MQKSKGCLPNGKGLNWLREGNFNFKLQVNVTNDVAKKKLLLKMFFLNMSTVETGRAEK